MQTKGEEALDRSVAQFFFEVGYAACWVDAFIQNDQKPPFHLTDAIIERAWQTSYESYEEPAEFDAKLAMANAAPELLEACKSMIPSGVCLTNTNIPDDFTVALDCTMGDLRAVAAAIARAKGIPS